MFRDGHSLDRAANSTAGGESGRGGRGGLTRPLPIGVCESKEPTPYMLEKRKRPSRKPQHQRWSLTSTGGISERVRPEKRDSGRSPSLQSRPDSSHLKDNILSGGRQSATSRHRGAPARSPPEPLRIQKARGRVEAPAISTLQPLAMGPPLLSHPEGPRRNYAVKHERYAVRKPRVFIVSSSEAASVRDLVLKRLSVFADVTPWNSKEIWHPNDFILRRLIELPRGYDFAVAILQPDDLVESRGVMFTQARDNVIFETGMFMGALGFDRTFILSPLGAQLKPMSDLAGFLYLEYPSQSASRKEMEAGVSECCDRIEQRIRRMGKTNGFPIPGPDGFLQGLDTAAAISDAARSKGDALTMKNIALDMEHTWGFIQDRFFGDKSWQNVNWRSLMLDHTSASFASVAGPRVSPGTARNCEEQIQTSMPQYEEQLGQRGVSFGCRAYSDPPRIHGFLINDETLLLNICGVDDGKLNPARFYMRFENERECDLATNYIECFAGLFEHLWSTARPIWPVQQK